MKLVELTGADGNRVHVNPEQVRFVTADREGRTEVVFDVSLSVVVRETLEGASQIIGRG
jgi:hypothetical protein